MYTEKEKKMTFLIYNSYSKNVLVGYGMVMLVHPQEEMRGQ